MKTEAERTVWHSLQGSPDGLSIEALADLTGFSYHKTRRTLIVLMGSDHVAVNGADTDNLSRTYRAVAQGRSMLIPHSDPTRSALSLIETIKTLSNTPVGQHPHVKQSKVMAYNLARLANLGAEMALGSNDPGDLADLRNDMEEASRYAYWQYKVYQAILCNKRLWNPISADGMWFQDEQYPFSPSEAADLVPTAVEHYRNSL
jgi:hypothetical protein